MKHTPKHTRTARPTLTAPRLLTAADLALVSGGGDEIEGPKDVILRKRPG